VHHSFRDTLAIEMRHLLEEQEIFEHHRSSRSHRERILVVAHWTARVGRHELAFLIRHRLPPQLSRYPDRWFTTDSFAALRTQDYAARSYTSNI
jgi:hypothetical protein